MNALSKTDDGVLPDLIEDPSSTGAPITIGKTSSFEDVPVRVSAVLGKTRIDIAQLKALGPGAIIELDRKVGEPIDLYVNDRLIARGELVMVDGSLGVTMTEIVKEDEK